MMQRVVVYVDGMNLFYGLRSKRNGSKGGKWPCYYWLDLRRMSQLLLHVDQKLAKICYFTARVHDDPNDPQKQRDQTTYLEALHALEDVEISLGYFIPKERRCRRCGSRWKTYEEKMTDVNIATELMGDAYEDTFDTAIVISADGDLAGPISAVLDRFTGKRIVVAFPPDRFSHRLAQIATGYLVIGRNAFSKSQLPDRLLNTDGYALTRPRNWN